jgi:hypothetical protein
LLLLSLIVLRFVPDPVTADARDRGRRVVSRPGGRPAHMLRPIAGWAVHRR